MGWRRQNRPPMVAGETLPSTWALPGFAKDERPDHPTPKPLEAFGIPMRQHVARGGLCYEPFSGSGSQIMAGEGEAEKGGHPVDGRPAERLPRLRDGDQPGLHRGGHRSLEGGDR